MSPSHPAIKLALDLLYRAFEGEYQYALACLDIHLAALAKPDSWNRDQNRVQDLELRKLLAVPALPGKFWLNPGCNLYTPRPWPEQNLKIIQQRLTRRAVLKASCYVHSEYEFVVRCLSNRSTPARVSNRMLEWRYDVVVQGDVARLANASQSICVTCRGASGLSGQPVCSRIPESCDAGYVHPPNLDLGEMGELVAIFRSKHVPTKFQILFDAEV